MPRKVAAQQLEFEVAFLEPPEAMQESRSLKPARSPYNGRASGVMGNNADGAPKRAASRPSAPKLLETPGALLTRSHLRGLGLERRAIDAVFRALPVVALPGYSRPMIRVEQYLQLVEEHTYRDDRVRPCHA